MALVSVTGIPLICGSPDAFGATFDLLEIERTKAMSMYLIQRTSSGVKTNPINRAQASISENDSGLKPMPTCRPSLISQKAGQTKTAADGMSTAGYSIVGDLSRTDLPSSPFKSYVAYVLTAS